MKEYALYRGEVIQGVGPLQWLSDKFGVSKEVLLCAANKKRIERAEKDRNNKTLIVVKIEEDDE